MIISININHVLVISFVVNRSLDEVKAGITEAPIGESVSVTRELEDYMYFKAFKVAIQEILTMVHDSREPLVVIHGTHGVGKSTLAKFLGHHLCKTGTDCNLVELNNDNLIDSNILTASIVDYLCSLKSYVIFDQLDVNKVDYTEFGRALKSRSRKKGKTVVAFTSGHYPPPKQVQGQESIYAMCCKIIDIQVDEEAVKGLMELYGYEEDGNWPIDPAEVVKITTNIGFVQQIIYVCTQASGEVTTKDMENAIYDNASFDDLGNDKQAVVLRSLWPDLARNPNTRAIATATSEEQAHMAESLKITPAAAQFAGSLLGECQDAQDKGSRWFVNHLCVSGEGCHSRNGFIMYDEQHTYFYCIRNVARIHGALNQALGLSDRQYYNKLLEMWDHKKTTNKTCIGTFFEQLISSRCKVGDPEIKHGLVVLPPGEVVVMMVDGTIDPKSPEELVSLVEEKRKGNRGNKRIFCDLNECKSNFPGYDFVSV